jgi:hypothetical protein
MPAPIEQFENSLLSPQLHYREKRICKMFTTAQRFILNSVTIVLDLMERGGHVLRGVTAHGSPGGRLQFDHLEAALATTFR